MTAKDERPQPGSFYRHALDVIQSAHPGRDPGWQREQARKIMSSTYDTRASLVPPEDIGGGPAYPRTPEALAQLEDDFREGEQVGDITRQTSSSSTSSGEYVEVMEVRGIVRLRRGGSPDAPAIYLTMPEWRIFLRDLERGSEPTRLTDLRPESNRELVDDLTDITPATRRELAGALQALA